MELEWEFDLKPREIADIRNELKNIIYNFFRESINPDCERIISKYSIIHETTTFLFERYRNQFESLIRNRFQYSVTEEYLELRRKSFIMGITLDVLLSISNSRLHIHTTPQMTE